MSDTYDVTSTEFSDFAMDEMKWEDRTESRFICGEYELSGTVLGFGASRDLKGHRNHPAGTRPPEGERCSACRWAEIAILWVRVGDAQTYTYALVTMGKTILEGEVTRPKTFWTEDAMSILEWLHVGGTNGVPRRIPLPNAHAFRYAAEVDAGIRVVLDEWNEAIAELPSEDTGLRAPNATW